MERRTIGDLQAGLHFGQQYSEAYRADPRPHRLLDRAVKHICKAAGKAVAVVEELDHTGGPMTDAQRAELTKALCDASICSAQAAKHAPGAPIDLDAAVWARAVEKDAWRDPDEPEADLVLAPRVPIHVVLHGRESISVGEDEPAGQPTRAELLAALRRWALALALALALDATGVDEARRVYPTAPPDPRLFELAEAERALLALVREARGDG
jgi:hypothetical protein